MLSNASFLSLFTQYKILNKEPKPVKTELSSNTSKKMNQWYDCSQCQVSFASQDRHTWHLEVCTSQDTKVQTP
ncbi:hypothetical protein BDF14DRAFT_1773351 [Spinellus fusiger]|nr:hypothetical protein BDF14DRAFT_1773351 [Spinellus fusiger]